MFVQLYSPSKGQALGRMDFRPARKGARTGFRGQGGKGLHKRHSSATNPALRARLLSADGGGDSEEELTPLSSPLAVPPFPPAPWCNFSSRSRTQPELLRPFPRRGRGGGERDTASSGCGMRS